MDASPQASLGQLHQIQVRFDPEQDRLLLRVNTSTRAELSCWLTRRLVKRLWPLLGRVAAQDPAVARQTSPEAKRAVQEFRREEAFQKTDFSRRFEEEARERPLGAEPVLVSKAHVGRTPGGLLLRLEPAQGPGLRLVLAEPLLISLCELLQRAVRSADWDLALDATGSAPGERPAAAPARIN